MGRIQKRFAALKAAGRSGLVTFVTAGDPDPETAEAILKGLPAAGADIIEIGMPFTDPAADGPAIQRAGWRALNGGMTLERTLDQVRALRVEDTETPVILMGYFNPIFHFGVDQFVTAAAAAGADGLIIVDLPPEEDDELRLPAKAAGLDFIRLATPTSDDERLKVILEGASGFVYYVSVAGITGKQSALAETVAPRVRRIQELGSLPVVVGFGIRTPDQAMAFARISDAAVVGSAIVNIIADNLDGDGKATPELVARTLAFVRDLSAGVKKA